MIFFSLSSKYNNLSRIIKRYIRKSRRKRWREVIIFLSKSINCEVTFSVIGTNASMSCCKAVKNCLDEATLIFLCLFVDNDDHVENYYSQNYSGIISHCQFEKPNWLKVISDSFYNNSFIFSDQITEILVVKLMLGKLLE